VESATDICVENFLANNRPNHLSAGLNTRGIAQPSFVIRETSAMEKSGTQPNENNGQLTKVGAKDFARHFFKVFGLAIEIVSVSVEVPNPGCGFGASSQGAIEVSGLTPLLERSWNRIFINLNLDFRIPLWGTDRH
jgi:hypothetical protein